MLVTGAGGSIGSELARQVHGFGPSELILLDRDESGLHGVQLSIYGQGLLEHPRHGAGRHPRRRHRGQSVSPSTGPTWCSMPPLLNICPMLEQYPDEGWKTNVLGTRNLLRAARGQRLHSFRQRFHRQGGRSKQRARTNQADGRAADRLVRPEEQMARTCRCGSGTYWAARGSMLHAFMAQIRAAEGRSPSLTRRSPGIS